VSADLQISVWKLLRAQPYIFGISDPLEPGKLKEERKRVARSLSPTLSKIRCMHQSKRSTLNKSRTDQNEVYVSNATTSKREQREQRDTEAFQTLRGEERKLD